MIHTYKYTLINGHIIASTGKSRLLIDTGAPNSVADSMSLAFAGAIHQTQRSGMGVTPESLSKSVGTPINALVGVDILNQYDIHIDPIGSTLSISENSLPLSGQHLEMGNLMGIPIINAMVSNDKVRLFFDTGAKLSYLDPDITKEFPLVGTEKDFYPGVGEFSTNAYDVPIILGTEAVVLRVGTLPMILQMTLMMAQTNGILGTAILQTHKVTYAPRRKTMTLERINA